MDVKAYNVFHQKIRCLRSLILFFSSFFARMKFFIVFLTQSLFIGYVVYSLTSILDEG